MRSLILAFCISTSALYCSTMPHEKRELNNLFLYLSQVKNTSVKNTWSLLKIFVEKYSDMKCVPSSNILAFHNVLRTALEEGADINCTGIYGFTALHMAAENGCLKTVEFLLEYEDIKISAKIHDGKTALHIAAKKGDYDIAKLLIKKGAKVDAKDSGKATPLHYAASQGHIKIVELLIENGACVNTTCSDDRTALHLALQGGYKEVAEFLLGHKDVDIHALCNHKGTRDTTALDIAYEKKLGDIIKTLTHKGARKRDVAALGSLTRSDLPKVTFPKLLKLF